MAGRGGNYIASAVTCMLERITSRSSWDWEIDLIV
jgi:hypothetical protein